MFDKNVRNGKITVYKSDEKHSERQIQCRCVVLTNKYDDFVIKRIYSFKDLYTYTLSVFR